jgi:hypothetical protein
MKSKKPLDKRPVNRDRNPGSAGDRRRDVC